MDRLSYAAEFQRLASRFWTIHERQDLESPEKQFVRACADAGNALRIVIEHQLIDGFDGFREMIPEYFAASDEPNSPGELKDFACQSWFLLCIQRMAQANTMNLKTLATGNGFRVEESSMSDWRLHSQSFCSFCAQLDAKILASKRFRDFKREAELAMHHSPKSVGHYAVRAVDAWADLIEPDPTMRPDYYATKLGEFYECMKLIRVENAAVLRELIVGFPLRSLKNYLATFWDILAYVLGDLDVWDNAKIDSILMSRIMQGLNDACRENGLNYQRNAVFAFVEEVERKLANSSNACLPESTNPDDAFELSDGFYPAKDLFVWGGKHYGELTDRMKDVLVVLWKEYPSGRKVSFAEMQRRVPGNWESGFYKCFRCKREGKDGPHPVKEIVIGHGKYRLIDPK